MTPRTGHTEGSPDTPGGEHRREHDDLIGATLGCLSALLVVGLLGAALFLLPSLLSIGPRERSPSAGDLDRAARSAAVSRAGAAATRREDTDLDTVTTAVRGDLIGADGYLDRCTDGTRGDKFSAPRPKARAMVCARSTLRALGGHGGPRAGLLALDRAMRSRGWYVQGAGPGIGVRLDPHAAPPDELAYTDRAGDVATVRWSATAPAATASGAVPAATPTAWPELPDLLSFPPDDAAAYAYSGFRSAGPSPSARDVARAAARHPYLLTVLLTDLYWRGGPGDL